MRFALSLITGLVALAAQGPLLFGQAAIEIVEPTETIPDAPYETWSLFLVCTPDWATPERSADLANLYRRFRVFGDAIGGENLAVWFWKQETELNDPDLYEKVDVARSAEYCRALALPPSEGPFLVVTSSYPSLPDFPADRAVYTLGALQPSQVAKVLNSLTDSLLLHGGVGSVVTPGTPAEPPSSTGFWVRLLEATQRSMIGFGCRLKLQISTGLLSAELRECPP